jgi:hypothetical protein
MRKRIQRWVHSTGTWRLSFEKIYSTSLSEVGTLPVPTAGDRQYSIYMFPRPCFRHRRSDADAVLHLPLLQLRVPQVMIATRQMAPSTGTGGLSNTPRQSCKWTRMPSLRPSSNTASEPCLGHQSGNLELPHHQPRVFCRSQEQLPPTVVPTHLYH